MPVKVFDPMQVQVGAIGEMMAEKVSDPELKSFFRAKDDKDGNLSAIVVGDSDAVGIGVGTWEPGQKTDEPIPVMFDEILFIVSGEFIITIDGVDTQVSQGSVAHLPAKQMVMFRSDVGCRLVWVTSPPTWKAIEEAWRQGKIPAPA